MRILTGEDWVDVIVYEPGQDAYGPWVVDGPANDLTNRTGYLKARLNGPYFWLPFYFEGDEPEVGDAICMAPSTNWLVKKATAYALTQAGIVLGICCGEGDGSIVPVAISGIVPPTITGLGAGTAGQIVRVDLTTSKAVRGTASGINHVLGRANLGGLLQLIPDQITV